MTDYHRDFTDRLSFIADGLKAEEMPSRGAELIIRDAQKSIWEMVEMVQALPTKARQLAELAEGKGPLLPETFSEVAMFKALAEAREMPHGLTARNFMGLTVTQLAAVLGVSRKTLSNIVNERAGVTPDMSLRLSRAFGTTPALWLNLQQAHDLWVAEHEPTGWEQVMPVPMPATPSDDTQASA
ncbi:HigA family addiction module antitoxin [Solidesulfovibrio carbinolicus]|nr:HigA family addiction module antitoxin [Solidesulfovibrio carbinolicus]